MKDERINTYITQRYDRWHDYAKYHCSLAGIEEESIDVLNEVLIMLLQKYESQTEYITRLYESKKGQYRELDFFVLQMIKLNIQSPTSPYQHKYKAIPTDENVDFQVLDIIEDVDFDEDKPGEILQKMQQVRQAFESLQLSEKAMRIFSWKFFESNSFSEWQGKEDRKELYEIYNGVLDLIRNKIEGRGLF